ncbi:hypothetical protein CXF78_04175 [Shewanella sp. 11B5]|uniref:hypothetical protein n=1 Tax=Shewanella sp. 11B5 TaxID=2058298 RepID=UPI000C7CD494|nr:hypothetical protein [Shewanella sp. 11B5]PKI07696.1 hypothetical protein CXF78_04175 [Shewanella sp. 11B5]|tara:strand:+ start:780 stop:1184 length:405 start_codon:yes stop_codon:yes gene_type:complete
MIEVVTTISLWELIKHAGSWVSNLKRANDDRKKASMDALQKVVEASRKTGIYLREVEETGQINREKEGELSMLWTELGFLLERLKLEKLAEKCHIKGKHWENPVKSDKDMLSKADVGLEKVEKMALEILRDLNS